MYHALRNRLTTVYPQGEASAIVFIVLEKLFGLSRTDVIMGRCGALVQSQLDTLDRVMLRLERGEPVQYVLGETEFDELNIHVEPGVLIPRPETEELVSWIADTHAEESAQATLPTRILDIGTGSGCIALALAKRMPQAEVTAWDLSDDALRIAADNALRLGLNVRVEKRDALDPVGVSTHQAPTPLYDIIVSNPPYICDSERKEMCVNVLDYEPAMALFVPDNDPLLFYRAISRNALHMLKPSGKLFFEINRQYGSEVVEMMHALGYSDIQLRKDFVGNDRFVCSTLKVHP